MNLDLLAVRGNWRVVICRDGAVAQPRSGDKNLAQGVLLRYRYCRLMYLRPGLSQQTHEIAAQNQSFVVGAESEKADLVQFDTWMEPWTIRSKQDLSRTGAFHSL